MAISPMSAVLQHLRTAFGQDGAGMSDGDLLTLFLEGRDEAPLAALVQRHAAMVWGVCCRLLRNHHDAEDAFQATFLVLVRKAESIKPRSAVGNWLYGVAYQTAVRVRSLAARRGGREKQVLDMPDPIVNEPGPDDLRALLDQELSRLPDKHRLVLVLGDLEGKTRKELAEQLGISEGVVAGRLARAREMLAKRLTRRGLAITGAALAAALPQCAGAAAPVPLVAATIQAMALAPEQAVSAGLLSTKVVAYTEGVVRAMFVSKIKTVLAVGLVAAVILGGLGIGRSLFSDHTNAFASVPDLGSVKKVVPQVFTGTIKADAADRAVKLLGRHGVLFIRTQARLDELRERMPDLTPDQPLPKIDFTRQHVVLVYALGNSRNSLTLSKPDLTARPPALEFMFRWYNGEQLAQETGSVKFIYAIIPATPAVNITVLSLPTDALNMTVVTELSARLGGDIVDGLQAAITPQAATIKPGDDMLIDFVLHLPAAGGAQPDKFGTKSTSVFVWDGKYSNGYRNHAFFVTTPKGETFLLRPKVIDEWRKNVPHPVGITAQQPYSLPNWAEGNKGKSLKSLGLDTTAPGTYTITGLYEEAVQQADRFNDGRVILWGGSIATNTITVEVKK